MDKCTHDSSVIISRILLPEDANAAGIVHGGVIMKEIDNAAGVCAVRHTRKICVTASIDRLDFHKPAFIGNLLTIKAGINMTGKTSMEIGARVQTPSGLGLSDLCGPGSGQAARAHPAPDPGNGRRYPAKPGGPGPQGPANV